MLTRILTATAVTAAVPLLVISAAAQAAPAASSQHVSSTKVSHSLPVSRFPLDTLHSHTVAASHTATPGAGNTGTSTPVTITNPLGPTIETPIYVTVTQQFSATSTAGDTSFNWTETGAMPAGMTFTSGGLLSGELGATSPGTYNMTVTATGATSGDTATDTFTWQVDNGYNLLTLNKCLDDSGAGTANGNKIDIWKCNFTPAQTWRFNTDGTLHLILGKCLTDPKAGGTRTNLVLSTCVGGSTQKWGTRATNKQVEIVLDSNGLCLTDPGSSTKNGTQVQVRDCTGEPDQLWGG